MDRIIVADRIGEYEALIDSEDRDLIAGFTWRPLRTDSGMVYAHAARRKLHVYMHRLVAGAGSGEEVDHDNRNGLDNRKANLRIATRSQNLANQPKQRRQEGRAATSQYKGVCWDKARGKWAVYIASGSPGQEKRRGVGRFDDEIEAARAYDRAAFERWGAFAMLNFEREDEAS